MAENPYTVSVQREKEDGKMTNLWLSASLTFDETAGTVTVASKGALAKKWAVTLRPDQITTYALDLISDTSTLALMYGGGLVGWLMAAIMSRWAKLPVLRLEQSMAEPGQRKVVVRGVGYPQRRATEKIARHFERFLNEHGFTGMMPDLSDENVWKFPMVPVLVGCGGVIAIIVLLVLCIVVAAALTNNF